MASPQAWELQWLGDSEREVGGVEPVAEMVLSAEAATPHG